MRPSQLALICHVIRSVIAGAVVTSSIATMAACFGADEPLAAKQESQTAASGGPLSPEQALKSFVTAPGLRVELVASEPDVESPVAIAFDENRRLFVAENRGYPTGAATPAGRITMLEDADEDGRYEKKSTFADGLTFPNGVMWWKGGLIVTCAPDILYLRDTDGDGRADERTVWFTGFSSEGSTQLRVSHPTLGIDNWIYVTSGLTGGAVTCPAHLERPAVQFGRTDFRFRPDLSEYETCDGGSQFGLSFDDFGHRFICNNRVQAQHVVLPSRYLRRNPHLAFSQTVQDCPVDVAPEPLSGHGQAARIFPISANVTTADSHAGTFTAACGVFVWRGHSLLPAYRGGVFSCDPTGNLVHFDKLTQNGATFAARPLLEGQEFLASRDNWCRPVFLALGPDDALYVCDMYRKTIEHPDYLPVEVRKHTDFETGKGMGRIWRVVSDKLLTEELSKRRLAKGSGESTAAALLHDANAFRQAIGHRLLLQDPQRDANELTQVSHDRPLFTRLAPEVKAHVLHLLKARGQLNDEVIQWSLADESAGVREQALIVAESRLAGSPKLVAAILSRADDSDPRVRFQWSLLAGELHDDRTIPGLAKLAIRDASDRWLRAAVLSSIEGREDKFLSELLRVSAARTKDVVAFYGEFGRLLGASRSNDDWAALLNRMVMSDGDVDCRATLVTGYVDALRGRNVRSEGGSVLLSVLHSEDVGVQLCRSKLQELIGQALKIAGDASADSGRRAIAIGLLAQADFKTSGATLLSLLDPQQPADVQSAAVRALSRMQDKAIAATLLSAERFPTYAPSMREEVLSAMLSRTEHLPELLVALESGAVPRGAIDALRRGQLTKHKDESIRKRAEGVFGVSQSSDRGQVYQKYKSILELAPNPEAGRVVFKKQCANCHRLDREGFTVGPDLFGIRNQPKESILLHVLIPEYEITKGFAAYVVETKDGRTLTGLIASETPTSITFRQALGKEETVLRNDIERLVASGLSLMPQEMENVMNRQDLADVIAYVKGENAGAPSQK